MKITLLGDSIRQQYGPKVKELLGDDFEVWYPDDNCRFAQYTLRGIFDWASNMEGSEIIHWNNGHWDLCDLFGDGTFTDVVEYVKTMVRIAELLKKKCKTVIFATTTPVRESNRYNKNEDVVRFNSLVVPELRRRGILINDLNSLLVGDIDRYICEDTIHLSEEGIDLCANQVVQCIKEAAKDISNGVVDGASQDCEKSPKGAGAPVLL